MSNEGIEQKDSQEPFEDMPIEASGPTDIRLPAIDPVDDLAASMGSRLRAEREKRGWTCEDVGARLKLQARLIRLIEQDDYSEISHAVYLRGYLTSYARLLGLPAILAERVVAEVSQPAPLVSTGRVSRSRYLLDRYSVSATYLVLTGLVIGPAVWLATHGGLEQNLARTVMLDGPTTSIEIAAPAAVQSQPTRFQTPSSNGGITPVPVLEADDQTRSVEEEATPIVASMAPFAASPAAIAPVASEPKELLKSGTHSLTLKLAEPSWVEITSARGEKLEYGLLNAGAERTYSSDSAISLRIGNANGAQVVADGQAVDLAPFQRANVAHLRVFAEGKLVSRIDS